MRHQRLIKYAQENRKTLTNAERRLWYYLRHKAMGPRFRRQHPIGPYIADFASLELRLVIELDGSQHRGSTYDGARDKYMRSRGWTVLRYWSWDVMRDTEAVLAGIAEAIEGLSPLPRGDRSAAG